MILRGAIVGYWLSSILIPLSDVVATSNKCSQPLQHIRSCFYTTTFVESLGDMIRQVLLMWFALEVLNPESLTNRQCCSCTVCADARCLPVVSWFDDLPFIVRFGKPSGTVLSVAKSSREGGVVSIVSSRTRTRASNQVHSHFPTYGYRAVFDVTIVQPVLHIYIPPSTVQQTTV